MPNFTADLTNNLRGGIQVLLKRDRLHSRTCLATHSGDIRRVIMNSKQSFGTRNFAGGTWNQCDDLPLTEALWELLQKTSVYAAIQEAVDARAKRTQLTQDQVLNELVAIGFASLYDAFDIDNEKIVFKKIDELPANIQKSILEMTCVLTKDGTTKITRIKLACKIKALDMLYRHLAL